MGGGAESGEAVPPPTPVGTGKVGLSSTGVFLVTILIQLVGYVPTFFFARGIGQAVDGKALLGTIQLFLLVASSINGIGDLRIGSAFIYFVARGQSPKEGATTYLGFRLAMVGLAGTVLFLLAPSLHLSMTDTLEMFGIWMTFPVFWSLSTLYTQVYVATGRSTFSQTPLLIESIVRGAALTYVALYLTGLNDPTGVPVPLATVNSPLTALWAMTIAYALGVAASTIYSLPVVVRNWGKFSVREGTRLFRWAWPLMGSLILLYLSGNVIQFFVVAELNTHWYNVFLAANGYRILALALPTAVAVPLFPHLSSLHKHLEYHAIRSRTWQALRYTAMVVVPGVVALVVYRVNFLNIMYSSTYATEGSDMLALLALSAIPTALSGIIGTSLNSVGQQRLELYLTSLQVVILVIVAVLLIRPVYPATLLNIPGNDGAGWAVLLSSIGALALNTYFMERLLAVRIQWRPIMTIAASAGVAFLAVASLNDFVNVNRYYILAGALALGFGVYGLMLVASGELTKEDARRISQFLGLPRSVGVAVAKICWRESWPDLEPAGPGEAKGLTEPPGG
ncbi:MAG: polysaccharide biosynthesis C-terminal domain-containing protein [Thermoplasmata archaeon]|nr:polysaccharide biosynthesis C-terminal domain-containing protein [Thermoplasmata archaeon]